MCSHQAVLLFSLHCNGSLFGQLIQHINTALVLEVTFASVFYFHSFDVNNKSLFHLINDRKFDSENKRNIKWNHHLQLLFSVRRLFSRYSRVFTFAHTSVQSFESPLWVHHIHRNQKTSASSISMTINDFVFIWITVNRK